MKYKINDKYIIEAKSYDLAIKAIQTFCDSINDATRHECIVYAKQILSEMGKNNSIGKYDKVVYAVANLFGEGFLEGQELKDRIRREIPRLLQKYGLNDSKTKDMEWLRTPRGTFEVHGTWSQFVARPDFDDWGFWFDHFTDDGKRYKIMHNGRENTAIAVLKDSIKDDDLSYLSKEEMKAVEDYKRAIANTTDPKMMKLFAHILQEETEHLEELRTVRPHDSAMNELDAFINGLIADPEQSGTTEFGQMKVRYSYNKSTNMLTVMKDNEVRRFNANDPHFDVELKKFLDVR